MSHMHWVARQNKLEIPRDKDEVNKWEIHKCDGREHDPDKMVSPLTPKPTLKAETLVRAPPTIASCREEDVALRKWSLTRYCCASYILQTKTKVGSTTVKVPAPRINPNINEVPTAPKSPTHPSHECDGRARATQRWRSPNRHPRRHTKSYPSSGHHRPGPHVITMSWVWVQHRHEFSSVLWAELNSWQPALYSSNLSWTEVFLFSPPIVFSFLLFEKLAGSSEGCL